MHKPTLQQDGDEEAGEDARDEQFEVEWGGGKIAGRVSLAGSGFSCRSKGGKL